MLNLRRKAIAAAVTSSVALYFFRSARYVTNGLNILTLQPAAACFPKSSVRHQSGDSLDGKGAASKESPKVTVIKKTDRELKREIEKLIKNRTVVLFMKGSPSEPQCGFSKKVVEILTVCGCSDFAYIDVLRSPRVRELIKEISAWPTIPQLFIKGEFIGGCDVICELAQSGELRLILEKASVVFMKPQDEQTELK